LKGSLKRLGLEYVDLWLIHTPIQHQSRIKEIWKQFEEVHKEGLAKNIGVSNFRIKDFEQLLDGAEITPTVNQVCSSIHILILRHWEF
jgi:diketogulonate reductase-like aldo/keto reductase